MRLSRKILALLLGVAMVLSLCMATLYASPHSENLATSAVPVSEVNPDDLVDKKAASTTNPDEKDAEAGENEMDDSVAKKKDESDNTIAATINTSDVILRAEPNTDCEMIGSLTTGDSVSIVEKLDGWYHVNCYGLDGYVAADYVTPCLDWKDVKKLKSDSKVLAVGIVNGSTVRMRKKPDTDSKVITALGQGIPVSIVGAKNGWYKVKFDGHTGYMSADYVSANKKVSGLVSYGEVTASALNIRQKANAEADCVGEVAYGTYVDVTGFKNGWYKIKYDDYKGYVSGDYLNLTITKPVAITETVETTDTSTDMSTSNSNSSSNSNSNSTSQKTTYSYSLPSGGSGGSITGSGRDVSSYAQSLQGVPYVYGGASTYGFDCSGFTMYVMRHFGYSLPHGATPQLNYGSSVSRSNLQPGDLVFFTGTYNTSSVASHVGIYVGGGQFVHASSGSGHVTTSSLSNSYYSSHYLTARHLG